MAEIAQSKADLDKAAHAHRLRHSHRPDASCPAGNASLNTDA
jgi:hypothetical protein